MAAVFTRRAIGMLWLGCALWPALTARAQHASPHAIDIPPWFTESFLDIQDEAAAAARDGKRLMLYFGQDGCPYCRELMTNSFSQKQSSRKRASTLWPSRSTCLATAR